MQGCVADVAELLQAGSRLKLWLPATLHAALEEQGRAASMTRPDFTRHALVSIVYGAITAVDRLRALDAWAHNDIVYSRTARVVGDPILPLGKSDVDSVVLVPPRLLVDLAHLAEQQRVAVGAYARNALQAVAFGHAVAPFAALREAGITRAGVSLLSRTSKLSLPDGPRALPASTWFGRLRANQKVDLLLDVDTNVAPTSILSDLARTWECPEATAAAQALTLFAWGRNALGAVGAARTRHPLAPPFKIRVTSQTRVALTTMATIAATSEADFAWSAIRRVAYGRVASMPQEE